MTAYQSAPYTRFHELLDSWKKQPQIIETAVKNFTDKVRFVGTNLDNAEFRMALEADEQRLQNLAQQTKTLAKQLAQEKDANRKDLTKADLDVANRIESAVNIALKKFDDIIREVTRKRQQYPLGSTNRLVDLDDDNRMGDDIQQRLQLQQQMKMNNELLLRQNEDQYEVEQQVHHVQKSVVEINYIMRDIGAMVSEQSPIIGQVEEHVIRANDNIVAGNDQLNSAARHQKKYRKKLCWLLLIFLIIAVIVTIVIILKLK